MVIIIRKILFAFLFLSIVVVAQENQRIDKSKNELQKVKNDIAKLEKELKSSEADKKSTIQLLEKINHQTHLVNKILKDIDVEKKLIENNILKLSKRVNKLEREIKELKKEYSEYIKWLYINGKDVKWNYLIHSGSINNAIIRYKYFNYISKKNKERLNELVHKKNEYEKLKEKLVLKTKEKNDLEADKKREMERLAKREKEKSELLIELNKSQSNIAKEIDKKRKYEIEIKNRITKLIEEARERERKLREERFKKNSAEPELPKINYAKFENFVELKGKMNWPVRSGKIIRAFGENRDPKLKTITINYGVDIKSRKGESVTAVAEGVVSVIDWIPGFGSIVIITHKGDYRTVYGHIDNISVNENQIVKAGSILGIVNESLEGNILHFEIWDERNYKNPQKWLAKK